jgi:hypothetical protein
MKGRVEEGRLNLVSDPKRAGEVDESNSTLIAQRALGIPNNPKKVTLLGIDERFDRDKDI